MLALETQPLTIFFYLKSIGNCRVHVIKKETSTYSSSQSTPNSNAAKDHIGISLSNFRHSRISRTWCINITRPLSTSSRGDTSGVWEKRHEIIKVISAPFLRLKRGTYHIVDIVASLRSPVWIRTQNKVVRYITWRSQYKCISIRTSKHLTYHW